MATKKMSGKEFMLRILGGSRDFSNVHLEDNFNFDAHPLAKEVRKCLSCQDWQKYPLVLSGAHLYGFSASRLNIPYVKADYITMNGCRIVESDFEGGVFYGGKIMNCIFVDDNFRRAIFACIDPKNESRSIGASIPRTRIFSSDLTAANCQRLTGDSNSKIKNCTAGGIKLKYGNLTGFDFTGTSMPFADVYGAILTLACFRNADFTYKNAKGEICGGLKNIEYALNVDMADFASTRMAPKFRKKLQTVVEQMKQDDINLERLIVYNNGAKSQPDRNSSRVNDSEIDYLFDILKK